MGRERTWKGQHLLLYTAFIIIIFLGISACSHVPERLLEEYHFRRADTLMNMGDYPASLKENETILKNGPKMLGDQALYRIGLIYAHPENENADEEKALISFGNILEKYPKSPLREQARLWVFKLMKMQNDKEKIMLLNGEVSDSKKLIEDKEREIESLKKRIEELESQIKDLKKIDLDIEGKKMKGIP